MQVKPLKRPFKRASLATATTWVGDLASLADETLLSLQHGICELYFNGFLLACRAPSSETTTIAVGTNRPAFDCDLLSMGFFCDTARRLDIPQGPWYEDLPGTSQRSNLYLVMFLLDVLRSYRRREVATR